MSLAELDPLVPGFGIAAFALLLAGLLLRSAARQDHRTWVMARAPRLPVKALAVGDDAWLRGVVRAATPLVCPWFGVACVGYRYTREREHTVTRRDAQGREERHSEWRTEHSEARAIDFELDDDGDRIVVRFAGAANEAAARFGPAHETMSLRHTAWALEVGATVSVLGVKQDDGSFGAQREVPCLVTLREGGERARANARGERSRFVAACVLAFAGGALGAIVALRGVAAAVIWPWGLLAGCATLLPIWALGTHNLLVRLREQVGAAFRQVDVDLAVRADLVPNLVACVRSGAAHEHDLLERIARLRAGGDPDAAVAAAATAGATARAVLVLHEAYPQLRADAVYRDLHDRLWAVEEKLAHSRQLYNDVATEWNVSSARFPTRLLARAMASRDAPLFAGDDAPLPPRLRG